MRFNRDVTLFQRQKMHFFCLKSRKLSFKIPGHLKCPRNLVQIYVVIILKKWARLIGHTFF